MRQQNRCKHCGAVLGWANQSGCCNPCRKERQCLICDKPEAQPGAGRVCEPCRVVLMNMEDIHSPERGSHEKSGRTDAELEEMARRAELELPLFEGLGRPGEMA